MKIFYVILLFLTTFTVSFSQNVAPGLDVIGKGYDIFGEYARNESLKDYPIFDFSKCTLKNTQDGYQIPNFTFLQNNSNHSIKDISGASMRDYASSLSTNVNINVNAFVFAATVNTLYGKETSEFEQRYCHTIMDANTKWKISLDDRGNNLFTILDDQFKNDIENLEPEKLFKLYGTHFIKSAYLGGRIDFSLSSVISEGITSQDIDIYAKSRFKIIKGDISLTGNENQKLNESNTLLVSKTIGGNSEFLNNVNNTEQYRIWAEGIKTQPVLCDFEKESLVPIWTLTKNEKRKNELVNYFETKIISEHPLPKLIEYKSVSEDPILDNKNLFYNFNLFIYGFNIIKDCDELTLTPNDPGDFYYSIVLNDKEIQRVTSKYPKQAHSGEWIDIKHTEQIKVPIESNQGINIYGSLSDVDTYTGDELVGKFNVTHKPPFNDSDLYNYIEKDNGSKWWKIDLKGTINCSASLYYQITKSNSKEATEYGNAGWQEFLKGNYDISLEKSKQALKLDNTLLYVHFNIALIYLIQKNPKAIDKYKFIINLTRDNNLLKAGLQDIYDYEKKIGKIEKSDEVKKIFIAKIN